MHIPSAKTEISKQDIFSILESAEEILNSGQLTLGPYTKKFEEEYAELVRSRYAIAVSSGTSALEICLRSLGVDGKQVIVPTNTNFGTAAAVLHAGGKLRLIDTEPTALSFNPADLTNSISSDTCGVIIVHLGGLITPRITEIREICHKADIFLLEDAAHAHGSFIGETMAGSFGDMAAFSFYPTKVITCCEGGIITTNSEELAEKAKIYRDQGKLPNRGNYHVVHGNSWRMSEIHAAVGLVQARRIHDIIEQRASIARIYDDGIARLPGIRSLLPLPGVVPNFYKYVAILPQEVDRISLKKILREEYNIALSGGIYDIPCHLQPVFEGSFLGGPFPVSEDFCSRHICLPIWSSMTADEAMYVLISLEKAVYRQQK